MSSKQFVIKNLGMTGVEKGLREGEFIGYASTFEEDLEGDIILREAFIETLAKSTRRALFWMHMKDAPNTMGEVWLSLDTKGLIAKGKIFLNGSNRQTVYQGVISGVYNMMSIGFWMLKSYMEAAKRIIEKIDLQEVSLIPENMAANPGALLLEAKSRESDLWAHLEKNKHDESFVRKVCESLRIANPKTYRQAFIEELKEIAGGINGQR